MTENKSTTISPEKYPKKNRDFGRKGIYIPKNLNNYNTYDKNENKYRFKNSLIITPFYETEFNVSGGIGYVKNHDGIVLFSGDNLFAVTNGIKKMPVLTKRDIKKHPAQKKLIVEEKYNFEEKYLIHKNIILYYEENRIDFQVQFSKSENESGTARNTKDITTEFLLELFVPELNAPFIYKMFNGKQEYEARHIDESKSAGIEYIELKCGKNNAVTLYPDRKQITRSDIDGKTMGFAVSNGAHPRNNYINLKIYLEKYKLT